MTTDFTLPEEFREKILLLFMGMIPKEKIDELIAREIAAFFDEESSLVINESSASVKKRNSSHYSSPPPTTFCIESKITPFRQLVWSVINKYIEPKITEVINDTKGQANMELNRWLVEEAKPKAEETFKAIFTQTANSMSQQMFYKTMQHSIEQSHLHMLQSLRAIGVDYTKIDSIGPCPPPIQKNI